VDFSQIDTNTKADILAGLDVQIPIKSNIELIVDPTADNDTDNQNLKYEVRKSTPFTTIQGAVNWASNKLALGNKRVTIRVKGNTTSSPRVYNESVSLPEVNASTGYISIESYSGNKDVLVESPQTDAGHYRSCMNAGSGSCHWVIRHLKFRYRLAATTATGQAMAVVGATANGARVDLHGCDLTVTSTANTIAGESYTVRMIDGDVGGSVWLYPDDKGSTISASFPTTNTAGIYIDMLNASRGGGIYFIRSSESENGTWACSGSCSHFINAWQAGYTNLLGGSGTQIAFSGTVNGPSVRVTTGSYVIAPASGFPGDSNENYIQTSTFCWAQGVD